jgi:fibronectin-binding autotransporter adhesin
LLEVRRNAAVPAFSLRIGFRAAPRGVRRHCVAALLVLLALLTLAPRGAAQTFTWTGAQNANWNIGNNWSGGAAPTGAGGENLVFPSGASNLLTSNNINNSTFNSIVIKGSGYTLSNKAVTVGAGGLADSSIGGANTITLPMTFAATRTVTVSNAATTLTISGVISGAGGLTKSGSGTVTLSAANTYTGVTTINVGTIAIAADVGLGAAPGAPTAGKLTFGGGTLRTTASFTLAANRGIALTGAGTISTDPGTTLTYGGIIAGASPLTKAGTGTLIASGANTYTGATAISAGTLQLGATNAVPSGTAVTVSGGATFDLQGFSDVIGSLAGAGTVTSGAAGAVTLTAGGNNGSTTFSGVMQNGSGTVALIKSGTGTLTLSGANTYSGATTVSAGVLDLQSNTALGSTAGATTVTSGAALQVDGSGLSIVEPLTLNGTGIASGGALRQLANTNTWSGAITLGSAARVNADAGTLTVSGGITNAGFLLTVGGAGSTTISTAVISGTGGLTKDGTGTVTLSANNTYTGTTTVSAGTLLVNGSQSSSAVSLNGGTVGGTGTVGAITSTAAGGTVSPGQGGPGILNSGSVNWSSGSPALVVQLNGTTAGSGYDQLNVTGTVSLSGATLSGTLGFSPAAGATFIIINNDGADPITGTFAGLPEGSNVVLSGQSFQISYVGGTGNDVVLTVAAPNLTVNNAVAPSASPPPGTDLTYTVTVTNNGSGNATSVVVVDTLAATLQFKVGSVVNTLPPGVSVLVAYSSDGGATWTYVPASGACSAPTNYDRCVNRIRWSLQNPLSSSAPNNTGTLKFVAQIR